MAIATKVKLAKSGQKMSLAEVLAELEALGTEQNRKIYKRHGAGDNLYGVSYANFGLLQKKIKLDHELAKQLWATDNYDARVLATMIADPHELNAELLENWVNDLNNYALADALAGLAVKTASARQKMEQWVQSDSEWIGRSGWLVLSHLALKDESLPDDYFEKYLPFIEQNIHTSRNWVRHGMNNALIAIGIRNKALEQKVLAVAARIGKVTVDHGETNCKTPDIASYISKTNEHRKTKQAVQV